MSDTRSAQHVRRCTAVVAAALPLQVHCRLCKGCGRVSVLGSSSSIAFGLLGGELAAHCYKDCHIVMWH
jgi:hypothetical protein